MSQPTRTNCFEIPTRSADPRAFLVIRHLTNVAKKIGADERLLPGASKDSHNRDRDNGGPLVTPSGEESGEVTSP